MQKTVAVSLQYDEVKVHHHSFSIFSADNSRDAVLQKEYQTSTHNELVLRSPRSHHLFDVLCIKEENLPVKHLEVDMTVGLSVFGHLKLSKENTSLDKRFKQNTTPRANKVTSQKSIFGSNRALNYPNFYNN